MQMGRQDTTTDVEDELRVAIKARQELGIDHEDEVIESFMSRVQDTIDARVEARVNEELRGLPTRPRFASPSNGRIKIVIGYTAACLALSIPIAGHAGRDRRGRNFRQHRVGGRNAHTPGGEGTCRAWPRQGRTRREEVEDANSVRDEAYYCVEPKFHPADRT